MDVNDIRGAIDPRAQDAQMTALIGMLARDPDQAAMVMMQMGLGPKEVMDLLAASGIQVDAGPRKPQVFAALTEVGVDSATAQQLSSGLSTNPAAPGVAPATDLFVPPDQQMQANPGDGLFSSGNPNPPGFIEGILRKIGTNLSGEPRAPEEIPVSEPVEPPPAPPPPDYSGVQPGLSAPNQPFSPYAGIGAGLSSPAMPPDPALDATGEPFNILPPQGDKADPKNSDALRGIGEALLGIQAPGAPQAPTLGTPPAPQVQSPPGNAIAEVVAALIGRRPGVQKTLTQALGGR